MWTSRSVMPITAYEGPRKTAVFQPVWAFTQPRIDDILLIQFCPMSTLDAVLARLKQEHAALGKAIAALEGVTSNGSAPRSRRPGISAAGRQRIAAAQRARWAKIKGRRVVSIATHKRTMSPAARRKIAAAQRARWAKVRRTKNG
jgi:hypothetical protein